MKSCNYLVSCLRISTLLLFRYQTSGLYGAVASDPPINDQCEGDIEVMPTESVAAQIFSYQKGCYEPNTDFITGSYDDATSSSPGCRGEDQVNNPDVWFSIEGTGDEIILEGHGDSDYYSIYSGSCGEGLTCVSDPRGPVWKSELGVKYYIHVQCDSPQWLLGSDYKDLFCSNPYNFTVTNRKKITPPSDSQVLCEEAPILTLDSTVSSVFGRDGYSDDDDEKRGSWHQFIGTGGKVIVSVRPNFSFLSMNIYEASCDEDGFVDSAFTDTDFIRKEIETLSGVAYFLKIDSIVGYTSFTEEFCFADYELKVESASDIINDQCEGAIEIMASPASTLTANGVEGDDQREVFTGSLNFATASDDLCSDNGTSDGIWFSIQGTGESMIIDDVRDPVVFTGLLSGILNNFTTFSVLKSDSSLPSSCNNEGLSCVGHGNTVSWDSESDAQYYILVSSNVEDRIGVDNTYEFTVTEQKEEVDKPQYCFSGDSIVQVLNKGNTPIKNVAIGDFVQVDGGDYSEVYSFGHYKQNIMVEYLSIDTGLKQPLVLSPIHMVFSENKKSVPASSLRIGDKLSLVDDGEVVTIQKIEKVMKRGAFAPFTRAGTIVVNDIVSSCYVSLQETSNLEIFSLSTPFSHHFIAHMSQAPHRLFCTINPEFCSSEDYDEDGISSRVYKSLFAGQWLLQQNSIVMGFGISFVLLFFIFAAVLEFAFLNPLTVLGCAVAWMYITGQKKAEKKGRTKSIEGY